MKSKVALLSLALASSVFALDEYMPVAPKTLEIDVGVNPVFPDAGGTITGVPLQVKYGIMTGLDVELAWTYASANDDAGGGSGFAQPAVALKYKLPSMDLSLFVNLTLPFATGDFDVPGLNMGIAPGALYQMTHGKITTILGAQYQLNLEADDVKDGNVLALLAKPSYAVNDKMGVYLWVGYNMYAESEVAGTGAGDESTAFIVGPGVTYTISDKLALEANLPITVADDVNKAWGIWASLYYTLPL